MVSPRFASPCVAYLFAVGATFVPLPTMAGETDEGVLVLNDGGVLHGHVSREGDRYIVVGAKSRVEVAANNVAISCGSMAEAYVEQQRRLPHDTAEAHLALADWCLRYNLLLQADLELQAARRIDSHSSQLDLLQRRLNVAAQATGPRAPVVNETEEEKERLAAETVRLEAIAAELPAGAVERFTRKVQPLLVNNCTTAGCHQMGGKQMFQLDRAVLHGQSNHRTTLGNLAATLALVNRDAPQLSLLLTVPRAEHAGMKQPIMGSRQDQQYRQLEEWVAAVTGTPMPPDDKAAVANAAGDAGSKRSTVSERPRKGTASRAASSQPRPFHPDIEQPVASTADKAADATDRSDSTATRESAVIQAEYGEPLPFQQLRQRKRPTAQLKTWQPKDAFDPEIFNRQSPPAATSADSKTEAPWQTSAGR
jgi:hypothetical protein